MIPRGATFALLLASLFIGSSPALAQTDAGVDDAGMPDAGAPDAGELEVPDGSVGEGGADRDNEEGEDATGRVPTVCAENRDCAGGFRCENRRCVYVGMRDAEGGFGCFGMATGGVAPMSFLALLFIRRRNSHRVC